MAWLPFHGHEDLGGFLLPVFPPSLAFLAGFAPGWRIWMCTGIAMHPPIS